MSKQFSNLPSHFVANELRKHLSPRNMASLVRAGKAGGATSNLRGNLRNLGKLEASYRNLYKWMNFLKTIPKTHKNITNNNLRQIQNSIATQNMKRVNKDKIMNILTNRFYGGYGGNRSPIQFPTKNRSAWLSVQLSKYYNHNRFSRKGGPVTIYIKKRQGDKIFVYRVIHPVIQPNYSNQNSSPWNWNENVFKAMRREIGNPNTTTLPLSNHQKKNVNGLLQKLYEEPSRKNRKRK